MSFLLSSGCSFTFGNELSDDIESKIPSKLSWAALLANHLGCRYSTVASPGASNQTIARSLIDSITLDQRPDKVAVMWTFTSRFEYNDRKQGKFIQVSHEQAKVDDRIKSFYDIVGDDEINELYTSLSSFLSVQEYLYKRKIPFIFTTADSNPLNRYYCRKPTRSLAALIKNIDWNRWYWIDPDHEDDGFYSWGKRNFTVGPKGHPLDAAHAKLSQDMLPMALTLLT